MILRVTYNRNAPAVGSYHVTLRHSVFGVISPFRVHVRLQREQQFFNRRFVKNSDISHRLQRVNQLCAFDSRHDRTPATFQSFDLRVRIHADDEHIAKLARAREVTNVSNMQHVETAVCQNDTDSVLSLGRNPRYQFFTT